MTERDDATDAPIYDSLKAEEINPAFSELQKKVAQYERQDEERERRLGLISEQWNWRTIVLMTLAG